MSACVGPETERERGRDAEAAILRDVAAGDALIDAHQVEAERCFLSERLVDVGGDAARSVAAEDQTTVDEGAVDGNLAFLIHDAASRAAAEGDPVGPCRTSTSS